jgi:hypothetical protein
MKTFKEVAEKVGLSEETTARYLKYMKARWANQESLQCATGYAQEWAVRFQEGREYSASDNTGVSVLKTIDKEGVKHGAFKS